MDLLCCESTSKSVAQKDPALLHDDRVFKTMLESEKRCLPAGDYMTTVQSDLTPNLRKIVVDWMWEVSIIIGITVERIDINKRRKKYISHIFRARNMMYYYYNYGF